MRDRVECRLRRKAEDIVVERTGVQVLAGHLVESRHPVGDEMLTTLVEFRYASAKGREGCWALMIATDRPREG